MKVEHIKPVPSFAPVVVTLETQAEVMLLAKLYGGLCSFDAEQVGGTGTKTDIWLALKCAAGASEYNSLPGLDIKVDR